MGPAFVKLKEIPPEGKVANNPPISMKMMKNDNEKFSAPLNAETNNKEIPPIIKDNTGISKTKVSSVIKSNNEKFSDNLKIETKESEVSTGIKDNTEVISVTKKMKSSP